MDQFRNQVRSIAIIDDDQDDYELVLEAFKEINPAISVHYIGSCDDVIKYREQKFDLVLLDINMPYHDGFFWLRSIRMQGYRNLPVIMYSNSLSPSHIAKAYEEGATLYFSKPDTYSTLISGLRKLVLLDWTDPLSITRQYKEQGRYKTFAV